MGSRANSIVMGIIGFFIGGILLGSLIKSLFLIVEISLGSWTRFLLGAVIGGSLCYFCWREVELRREAKNGLMRIKAEIEEEKYKEY